MLGESQMAGVVSIISRESSIVVQLSLSLSERKWGGRTSTAPEVFPDAARRVYTRLQYLHQHFLRISALPIRAEGRVCFTA